MNKKMKLLLKWNPSHNGEKDDVVVVVMLLMRMGRCLYSVRGKNFVLIHNIGECNSLHEAHQKSFLGNQISYFKQENCEISVFKSLDPHLARKIVFLSSQLYRLRRF